MIRYWWTLFVPKRKTQKIYLCVLNSLLARKRKYIKTLSIKGSIKLIFFRKGIEYVYNRLAFN